MKIAVFAHSCLLEVNRAIYRRIAENGFSIRIIVPSNYPVALQPSDGEVEVVSSHRSGKGQRFHWYPEAFALLDDFSPDYVILDLEADSLLAVQLSRWCSLRRRKFIIQTCENLPISDTTRGKSLLVRLGHYALRRLFLAYTVERTWHVFPISIMGANLLASFGFKPNQITRIPLGVDMVKFRPSEMERSQIRTNWNVPAGLPVVAYVGRMIPQKGVHLLLDALAHLGDLAWKIAIDDFRINVSDQDTSATYATEIKKILSLPVFKDRVIWVHAAHHEIPKVMNGIDILVAPSIRIDGFLEQYGRVIPEALACGTMVIASDTGAFPQVGGKAALYFEEGNVHDLRSVLRDAILLSEQERMTNADDRRAFATDHLSLDEQWLIMSRVISV